MLQCATGGSGATGPDGPVGAQGFAGATGNVVSRWSECADFMTL